MKAKTKAHIKESKPGMIHRLLPGLLTTVVVLAILWLTLAPQPLPETDIPIFPGADKLVHAIMFGGLAGVLCLDRDLWRARKLRRTGVLPKPSTLIPPRNVLIIICIILFTAALGGVIELLQEGMHVGRSGDVLDFISDSAGAVLGGIAGPPVARWMTGLKG